MPRSLEEAREVIEAAADRLRELDRRYEGRRIPWRARREWRRLVAVIEAEQQEAGRRGLPNA